MKGREFGRLARRYLLPHLPSFGAHGRLIFQVPILPLLRGFAFDPSTFDACSFDLHVFVFPSYVKQEFISYEFGEEIGSWRLTTRNEADVMSQVLSAIADKGFPFLAKIETTDQFIEYLHATYSDSQQVWMLETLACSLVEAGRPQEALESLATLERRHGSADEPDWVQDTVARGRLLRNAIDSGPETVRPMLQGWRCETLRMLGLVKYGGDDHPRSARDRLE